jgi:hypothetical protein
MNRDMDKTEKHAKNANIGFGKMFTAVTAGVGTAIASLQLFGKAFRAIEGFAKESFEAAKDQKKAHDTVRSNYQW